MRRRPLVTAVLAATVGLGLLQPSLAAQAAPTPPASDDTPTLLTPKGEHETGAEEQSFDKLRDAYYWSRLLAGDDPISLDQAASLRESASRTAAGISSARMPRQTTGGTWTQQGPNPIVQNGRTTNTFQAVSGRIGALAFRNDGTIILGAAQGGIWTYDASTKTWTSRTADARHAVGRRTRDRPEQRQDRLPRAPARARCRVTRTTATASSGVTDGGVTWSHVSAKFTGQATSALAVDPTNANHVYAATLRGRGGARRTTAPDEDPVRRLGVQRRRHHVDAAQGHNRRAARRDRPGHRPAEPEGPVGVLLGRRHLPQSPTAARPGAARSATCRPATSSRAAPASPSASPGPSADKPPTLYTGFDYFDLSDKYHGGAVWKSTDGGTTWTDATGATSGLDSVAGYCGTQCFYDNVVKPDPTNPDIVYALGSYGYNHSPAVRRHLPLHRRRQDLEEPRLRPAPRLPRPRLPAHRHQAHRHRQRRRRLAVAGPVAGAWARRTR